MSSTHLTKKEILHDPIAATVEHQVENLAAHKGLVKIVGIGLAVVLVAFGGYKLYSNSQETARAEALVAARRVLSATVGPNVAKPPAVNFPTEEVKTQAKLDTFSKLAKQYPGTAEAAIAQFYVASINTEKGDLNAAAAAFRDVADRGPTDFASSAKLSLAQILWGQGKQDDAKKMLEDLQSHPTAFVTRDEALVVEARLMSDTDPKGALALLDTLKNPQGPAIPAMVQLRGQIAQKFGN